MRTAADSRYTAHRYPCTSCRTLRNSYTLSSGCYTKYSHNDRPKSILRGYHVVINIIVEFLHLGFDSVDDLLVVSQNLELLDEFSPVDGVFVLVTEVQQEIDFFGGECDVEVPERMSEFKVGDGVGVVFVELFEDFFHGFGAGS